MPMHLDINIIPWPYPLGEFYYNIYYKIELD